MYYLTTGQQSRRAGSAATTAASQPVGIWGYQRSRKVREVTMPRPSLREKILVEGFNVVLEQGYCGATVRDIVRAADVPQGSFTNHFESKEAFCLELLIRYFAMVQQNITKTLRNDSLKPLPRLRQWFDIQYDFLKQADFRNGCLIGNFSAEAGAHSETIHAKLAEIHVEI